jgi:4-hydroxybutyrate CoA-transferase
MTSWQEEYKKKLVSADEAVSRVKSGDRVVFTPGREAFAVGLALAARKEELKGVTVFTPSPGYDFGWYDAGWSDSFEVSIMMPTAVCQDAVDAKLIALNPGTLIPFEEGPDAPKSDVLLTEVSTPDERGFCSFGASVWNKRRVIAEAKLTIAEVNPNLIRTYGDNYIHISEIDYFVEHLSMGGAPGMGSLAGRAVKETEPYLYNVAQNVSDLIRDGDTIQIGVGRTTEPLVKLGIFKGRRDLGWHSEATPGGVISLVREGVINGSRKTLHPGKCVVTSLGGGTKEEMDWVTMNPLFMLVDIGYLEDIRVIAAHDNMVAINNALAIDLSGQIGAESIGYRFMAVAGGQIPFVFGATLSKGGRSITCLPSTAQGGKISRIVPTLPPGTVVTIQRNLTDNVVTEYGIARLKGKTLRQRAQELINVAHPDFRAELKKAAEKLYWP